MLGFFLLELILYFLDWTGFFYFLDWTGFF